MDPNLNKIAQEIYGKIQTRFPSIKFGDEHGQVLSKEEDIPNARFFEFEYEYDGEPLGNITITLDGQKGIVMQISGDLANNITSTADPAYKFIKSFRKFAKTRMLKFDVQNIGKSNLDKRDYQFQAKRKEPAIMENKLFGTSRVSYQNLGEARLIIKHSQQVNPDLPAGRTMHIESIYIENADGERFKYPFKHLNGARALAEHIKHGGNPYDGIGKHITGLSEELNQLRKFKGFVVRTPMVSEAMGTVTDRVIERIEEIKKEIHGLQRSAFYEQFVETFEETEEQSIPEEVINNLVDRLTVRTFNEELKAAFPYIYKFIDESELPIRELTADDFLDEEVEEEEEEHDQVEAFDPELAYESFIDYIVKEDKDELFSPLPGSQNKAIENLNELLATELSNGSNVSLGLKGIIDDPRLIDKIRVLNNDQDIREQIKEYILDRDPKLLPRVSFPESGEEIGGTNIEPPPSAELPPIPEPSAAPLPATAPAAPTAPTEVPAIAEGSMCMSHPSGLEEMLKYISGFYNREDKSFPLGGERIKIKVKKDFESGMFPTATMEDLVKIVKFIDKKDPSPLTYASPDIEPVIEKHDSRAEHLDELMTDLDRSMFEDIVKLAGLK